jgi:hypothetical protein
MGEEIAEVFRCSNRNLKILFDCVVQITYPKTSHGGLP